MFSLNYGFILFFFVFSQTRQVVPLTHITDTLSPASLCWWGIVLWTTLYYPWARHSTDDGKTNTYKFSEGSTQTLTSARSSSSVRRCGVTLGGPRCTSLRRWGTRDTWEWLSSATDTSPNSTFCSRQWRARVRISTRGWARRHGTNSWLMHYCI